MSEAVKVMVRCRPMNERENRQKESNIIQIDQKISQLVITHPSQKDNEKTFTYDAVFKEKDAQQYIYEHSAFPVIESVAQGFNGSGKTHTMSGLPTSQETRGILPRTFNHILNIIRENTNSDTRYLVRCSFLEIYNEDIFDLLVPSNKQDKLELKEDQQKAFYVKGLSQYICRDMKDMENYMSKGNANRTTGETLMNKDSSRSHSIFTLLVEKETNDKNKNARFTLGKLNLVDLAGSERQAKTQSSGQRLKEAAKINLSLSALGNVISSLVDGKSTHIPYRDSKLTKLLQDSLGGNTKTLMIATISPAAYNYEETLSTLRYATRAKSIKNKPKINEDPKDALLREYAEEIKRLKEMLASAKGGAAPTPAKVKVKERIVYVKVGEDGEIVEKDKESEISGRKGKKGAASQAESANEAGTAKSKEEEEALKQQLTGLESERQQLHKDLMTKDQAFQEQQQHNEQLRRLTEELQNQLVKSEEVQTAKASEEYALLKQRLSEEAEEKEKIMKEQKKMEVELLERERVYSSLQEEVTEKTKLLKDLRKKYKQAERELQDIGRENEFERADLCETIRSQERELK